MRRTSRPGTHAHTSWVIRQAHRREINTGSRVPPQPGTVFAAAAEASNLHLDWLLDVTPGDTSVSVQWRNVAELVCWEEGIDSEHLEALTGRTYTALAQTRHRTRIKIDARREWAHCYAVLRAKLEHWHAQTAYEGKAMPGAGA